MSPLTDEPFEPPWLDALTDVLTRDTRAKEWVNPEPWIQAEMFAWLRDKHEEPERRHVFAGEIPYATRSPYRPSGRGSDTQSALPYKFADMCVHHTPADAPPERTTWYWLELKVRFRETHQRRTTDARDAFCKDIASLMGFHVGETLYHWTGKNPASRSEWHQKTLENPSRLLLSGRHHFTAAFVELPALSTPKQSAEARAAFNSLGWSKDKLGDRVTYWCNLRAKSDSIAVRDFQLISTPDRLPDPRFHILLASFPAPPLSGDSSGPSATDGGT